MTRDGPSTSRLGFGYKQAREAGAPFRGPRSKAAINLENVLKTRPHLRAAADTLRGKGERADTILKQLRDTGQVGCFYVDYFRHDEECTNDCYSDDEVKLRDEIEWSLRLGAQKAARLWKYDCATGKWHAIAEFPD